MCWCSSILGKNKPRYFKLRREKVAPELNHNYKQLTFKTEDHPKLLFGDDLLKTIKDISETNKVGQSLTQRYQPALKRETFTKTGKPFSSKSRGYQQRGRPRQKFDRMFNHIHLTNKGSQSIDSTRTLLCQTISAWFPNSGKWTCT